MIIKQLIFAFVLLSHSLAINDWTIKEDCDTLWSILPLVIDKEVDDPNQSQTAVHKDLDYLSTDDLIKNYFECFKYLKVFPLKRSYFKTISKRLTNQNIMTVNDILNKKDIIFGERQRNKKERKYLPGILVKKWKN